jgi:hypothetical protein
MNSPTIYVIHGLTETDGDSKVFLVLESSLPKHKIAVALKKSCPSLFSCKMPSEVELAKLAKVLGDRAAVKCYKSIDIDDLL